MPNKLPHEEYETRHKTHAVGKRPALPADKNHQECDGPILPRSSHRTVFSNGGRHFLFGHDTALSHGVAVQNQVHSPHPGHPLQHAGGHDAGYHSALDWRPAGYFQPFVREKLPVDCGFRGR